MDWTSVVHPLCSTVTTVVAGTVGCATVSRSRRSYRGSHGYCTLVACVSGTGFALLGRVITHLLLPPLSSLSSLRVLSDDPRSTGITVLTSITVVVLSLILTFS
jgi:hypothetical protein